MIIKKKNNTSSRYNKYPPASFVETEIRRCGMEMKKTSNHILIPCPFHKDTNPSLGISLGGEVPAGVFHCFTKDTNVIIIDKHKEKSVTISSILNESVYVLDGNKRPVKTRFVGLGSHKVYELHLAKRIALFGRGFTCHIIRCSSKHRWFLKEKENNV